MSMLQCTYWCHKFKKTTAGGISHNMGDVTPVRQLLPPERRIHGKICEQMGPYESVSLKK